MGFFFPSCISHVMSFPGYHNLTLYNLTTLFHPLCSCYMKANILSNSALYPHFPFYNVLLGYLGKYTRYLKWTDGSATKYATIWTNFKPILQYHLCNLKQHLLCTPSIFWLMRIKAGMYVNLLKYWFRVIIISNSNCNFLNVNRNDVEPSVSFS